MLAPFARFSSCALSLPTSRLRCAQALTQFIKEHASGKFELPKKQTEEEDKADAEEAAARESEEQAAACALTPTPDSCCFPGTARSRPALCQCFVDVEISGNDCCKCSAKHTSMYITSR